MAHLSDLQGRVVLCGAGQAANGIDDRPSYGGRGLAIPGPQTAILRPAAGPKSVLRHRLRGARHATRFLGVLAAKLRITVAIYAFM